MLNTIPEEITECSIDTPQDTPQVKKLLSVLVGEMNQQRIEKVFLKVPNLVGQKFKYTQIDREEKAETLKMLCTGLNAPVLSAGFFG
jgi:hypothetical protein